MPRQNRIIIPNVPYHITQRGNNRIDVFYNISDRKNYLKWMLQYSSWYKFDIISYCLMTNHVHFVGIPRKTDSIAMTFKVVNMMHTKSINHQKEWQGHLWHSRYFSAPLDDRHLWLALRYVEQNPVRSKITVKAWEYPWSSAKAHCGLADDALVTHEEDLAEMFDGWKERLSEIPDIESIEKIRRCTYQGRPCGARRFTRSMCEKMKIQFNPGKVGRPKGSS